MIFKIDFQKIKKIVDSVDPLGLLSIGAPDNEYDIESAKIFENLKTTDNLEKIRNVVSEIFIKQFDEQTVKNAEQKLNLISQQINNYFKGKQ